MKNYLFTLIFLIFGLQGYTQGILLFPESTAYTSGDLPAGLCVRMSSELIKSIQVQDTAAVKQLRNLGRRLMRLGYHDYAKDAFEKLLDIHGKAYPKTDERYIWALVDLARIYLFLIRYDEMGPMYDEAADLMAKAKGENSYERALILSESVEPGFYLSDYFVSLRQAERVLKILEKSKHKDELHYGIILSNIGANKLHTEGLEQGIAVLQKAFDILKNPKYPKQYIIVVAANLAEAYAKKGDLEKAKTLMRVYHPLAREVLNDKITTYARVWLQLGQAYTAMKDYDGAEACFKKAYITNSLVFNKIDDIAAESEALFFKNQFLATCAQAGATMYSVLMYKDKYQQNKDLKALKDAFILVKVMGKFKKQLQESFTSEKNKLTLYRLGATLMLETGVELAYELYGKTGDKSYLEEAFSLSENGKSTLLVHSLRSKESKRFGNLPKALLDEEANLQAKLKEAQKRLIEAETEQARKAVRDELNTLNRDFLRFKEDIAQRYPNYYKHHFRTEMVSIKNIQAMLPVGTALIEYALGESRSFAFVITQNSFDMVDLNIDYNEMRRHSDDLRRALSDYEYIRDNSDKARTKFVNSSSYFHDKFVAPLLSKTNNIKELVIVPDKDLGHLPFEVFLSKTPEKTDTYKDFAYLLHDFAISYTYSASVLLERKEQDAKTRLQPEKRGVLAFAGEYEGRMPMAMADTLGRRSSVRSLRQALEPLPGAKQEVALMRKYLYGEFFDGQSAGEKYFKERAGQYNIIHLAMHGILDSNEPILSSLAFSEDGDANEDNFLHSYEITELDLKARLVVLSACETGYGKFRQGEGVMSLAHSFMYAGASSVLVSLWQVNDNATGEIMKLYYVNLSLGYEKDKALQKAKLEFLEKSEGLVAHPAFWAAFVQLGDDSPLELVCKIGLTLRERMLIMSGILLLVVGGGYFFWRRSRLKRAA